MAGLVVTEALIRREAGAASYDRGYDYFADGRVRRFTRDGESARATVDGDHPYRVHIERTLTGLDAECSCPQGQQGAFCKHCVATALVWVDRVRPGPADASHPQTSARLRAFLLDQDVGWLAHELVRAADSDPLLRARLEVAAGADRREVFDDGALRELLGQAVEAGAEDVGEALLAVERLVGQGFPDAAVTLSEYALELMETNADLVDDPAGELGVAIEHAEHVHLLACRAGRPDPVELAERLATRALTSEYDVFLTALPDYAGVLGESGMRRYREVVEAAWRELPPGSFPAIMLMERLAETEGGVDALVEVLSRDVTSAATVWRIAGALADEGRDDEALAWAERGLAEFPPDPRLRDLAADCHLRAGRRAEALELLWASFTADPCLATYLEVCETAGDERARWRERALEHLTGRPATRSVLVELLMYEGDVDAAWTAAHTSDCAEELRLRLARARARTHPSDAITVLRDVAVRLVGRKDRDAYREAAQLLDEAYSLARRCGELDAFRDQMARLRTEHSRRRALREELDRAGLP